MLMKIHPAPKVTIEHWLENGRWVYVVTDGVKVKFAWEGYEQAEKLLANWGKTL